MIGEAANNIQRVDPVFAKKNAEIPWQVMYAMRNRLSHGYEKVDNEMVWETLADSDTLVVADVVLDPVWLDVDVSVKLCVVDRENENEPV